MMYTGVRKVEVKVYTDINKVETKVVKHTFKTCGYTIDECRKNLNKKIKEYSENPYIQKVIPVSEYFEN